MIRFSICLLCLTVAANAAAPKPIDRGVLHGTDETTPISVTLTLALPALNEAENLQQRIYTPGDPLYHHFLTPQEFAARFGPSDSEVARISASLARFGLTAERTTAMTLRVTGMPVDMERAFSVSLHRYEVGPEGNTAGYTFRAPASAAVIPGDIASSVRGVLGLNNRPAFRSHVKKAAAGLHAGPGASTSVKTGDPFGSLTVTDFAANYDVDPLYSAGVTGSGKTIGILTLAAFTPSDAYTYWAAVGLNVAPNRISVVNIDGGPGAPSDASGSDETTLDVEQSGGIAPQANIIVYQAPNTNQGFVDLFAQAVEDNTADSFSTSWGNWEWFENLDNSPATDPYNSSETVASTQAIHEVLLRASMQGQTAFAAAGDGGAYDVVNDLGCPVPYSATVANSCSATLSVDYPASDTLMTAAGGTTLAGHQSYCLNGACTAPYYQVQIPKESVWGWDYLNGLCAALGVNPVGCGTFGVGGGGGVSVAFAEPSYQVGLAGMQTSQPGQAFYLQPYGLLYSPPANFAGRNVPDVSFNADPQTGYVIVYTSDVNGFGAETFIGGTSFVAPQLNGVTALLNQYVGKRVGFLNPTLYGLAASGRAYGGSNAPVNQVTAGDNWFYSGAKGYNLGSGLGTLDVSNFAAYLRSQF